MSKIILSADRTCDIGAELQKKYSVNLISYSITLEGKKYMDSVSFPSTVAFPFSNWTVLSSHLFRNDCALKHWHLEDAKSYSSTESKHQIWESLAIICAFYSTG